MRKITILDIAKETGISKSTVSRYLSGGSISAEKSKIIEKKINELGYIRNNFAGMLRKSSSNLIGVIVPDLKNPFYSNIVYEVERIADVMGITIIVKTSNGSAAKEVEILKYFSGFQVAAVILCSSNIDFSSLERFQKAIRFVSIDNIIEGINNVVSNNLKSGYEITKYIAENVNNNVLFVRRVSDRSSVLDREEGFIRACNEIGKQYYIYKYDNKYGINYEDFKEFINSHNIEGILCRNDNEAIKLMSNLSNFNNLRYFGFDNIELSELVKPKLTTVDQNSYEMCKIALDIIINKTDTIKNYIIDAKLIIRSN